MIQRFGQYHYFLVFIEIQWDSNKYRHFCLLVPGMERKVEGRMNHLQNQKTLLIHKLNAKNDLSIFVQ